MRSLRPWKETSFHREAPKTRSLNGGSNSRALRSHGPNPDKGYGTGIRRGRGCDSPQVHFSLVFSFLFSVLSQEKCDLEGGIGAFKQKSIKDCRERSSLKVHFHHHSFAPCSLRSFTISVWPFSCARSKGVSDMGGSIGRTKPYLFTSAPLEIRNSTMLLWPFREAKTSAVWPR